MIKILNIVICIFLTGCAYVSKDVTMGVTNLDSWSIQTYGDITRLEYICDNNKSVQVKYNGNLVRDGKVYFVFFVIPVYTAKMFDKTYTGIKIETTYTKTSNSCENGNVLLDIKGGKNIPSKLIQNETNKSICNHNWDIPLNEEGEFTLTFKEFEKCRIPLLQFRYETELNYNYDNIKP